jgi:hypothetical protein
MPRPSLGMTSIKRKRGIQVFDGGALRDWNEYVRLLVGLLG